MKGYTFLQLVSDGYPNPNSFLMTLHFHEMVIWEKVTLLPEVRRTG